MTSQTSTQAPAATRLALIDQDLAAARSMIKTLEAHIEAAEIHRVKVAQEVLVEAAAAASGSLPVGTRVRHRTYLDLLGTVAPSDGTGIAVTQDDFDTTTYGFGLDEWVPID